MTPSVQQHNTPRRRAGGFLRQRHCLPLFVLVAWCAVAAPAPARAHGAAQGTVMVSLRGASATFTAQLPQGALAAADDNGDGLLSQGEISRHRTRLEPLTPALVRLADERGRPGVVAFTDWVIPFSPAAGKPPPAASVKLVRQVQFAQPPQVLRVRVGRAAMTARGATVLVEAPGGPWLARSLTPGATVVFDLSPASSPGTARWGWHGLWRTLAWPLVWLSLLLAVDTGRRQKNGVWPVAACGLGLWLGAWLVLAGQTTFPMPWGLWAAALALPGAWLACKKKATAPWGPVRQTCLAFGLGLLGGGALGAALAATPVLAQQQEAAAAGLLWGVAGGVALAAVGLLAVARLVAGGLAKKQDCQKTSGLVYLSPASSLASRRA